eukprot:scaffold333604_cov21-Prasinocladus_malaysianus.AAC.1
MKFGSMFRAALWADADKCSMKLAASTSKRRRTAEGVRGGAICVRGSCMYDGVYGVYEYEYEYEAT